MKKEKDEVIEETLESEVAPQDSEQETVDEAVEAVAEDVEAVSEVIASMENRYKRLQADFENYKRRTAQEREQLAGYVKGEVMKDLLGVLDNFERAVQVETTPENKAFLDGFIMIHQNLMAMLSKQGLAVIEAEGKPFDPNLHQAIMRVEDPDKEDDTVAEVLQTGYMIDGKTLRPAMVKVVSNS